MKNSLRSNKFLIIFTLLLMIRIPLDIFGMNSLSYYLKYTSLMPSPQAFKDYPSVGDQKEDHRFVVQVKLKSGETQIFPYFKKAYSSEFSNEKKIALLMSSKSLAFKSPHHQLIAQRNIKNFVCNDVSNIESFTMGSIPFVCD